MAFVPIQALKEMTKGNIFFETGTHKGDGIQSALEVGFDQIISIEIDKHFVEVSSNRFAKEISNGQVQIFEGDTLKIMGDVIEKINEHITFWLDAHWDVGSSICGEKKCPLYEELNFIKNHQIKNHLILIDDMRLMGSPEAWGVNVHKEKIIENILKINKDYKFSYINTPPFGEDVLVAQI